MRALALEISWHDSLSVWALDASESAGITRLVTGGGDKTARVWRLCPVASARDRELKTPVDVEWICDLRAHTSTVNVVRFAPCGTSIATAADGGEIALWALARSTPKSTAIAPNTGALQNTGPAFGNVAAGSSPDAERWDCVRTLRGHVHDVLDLSWSPCGTMLSSASVDNSVMVWNLASPLSTPVALRQHSNFVQGVAFHPSGELLASLGNDRFLRVFSRMQRNSGEWTLVASAGSSPHGDHRLFVDDMNSKNVFRRLDWSPDGNLLVCPSGVHVPPAGNKKLFAVHVFSRHNLKSPIAQCGSMSCPAVVTRFCPVLFKLRSAGQTSMDSVRSGTVLPPPEAASFPTNPTQRSAITDSVPTQSDPAPVIASPVSAAPAISNLVPPTNSIGFAGNPSVSHTAQSQARVHMPSSGLQSPSKRPADAQTNGIAPRQIFSALPYRMVFAVGCTDAIFLYDTESFTRPIARISGLHLAEITDLSWTPDGRTLLISSVDGYVSIVSFSESDLGSRIPQSDLPIHIRRSSSAALSTNEPSSTETVTVAPKRSLSKMNPNTESQPSQPVRVVPQRSSFPPNSKQSNTRGITTQHPNILSDLGSNSKNMFEASSPAKP